MDLIKEIMRFGYIFIVLTLFISGCGLSIGKEIGRVSVLNENGQADGDLSFHFEAGDEISFWTDDEMTFEDGVGVNIHVEILKDGTSYKSIDFDPRNTKGCISDEKKKRKGITNWECHCENESLAIEESGDYKFKVNYTSINDSTLHIKKLDFIIRK